MSDDTIRGVEQKQLRTDIPDFRVGDTVDVRTRIKEGDKERLQHFTGVVIRRSGGGINENFVVRRIVQGEGVERTFPLNTPHIAEIIVRRRGKVRRASLYFLRSRRGKAARIKGRRVSEDAGKNPTT